MSERDCRLGECAILGAFTWLCHASEQTYLEIFEIGGCGNMSFTDEVHAMQV